MKVVVGSVNPVKIEAVKIGFHSIFSYTDDIEIIGVDVQSDVSDQPIGEEVTIKGAVSRAANAQKLKPSADYWVGIEAGIQVGKDHMIEVAYIMVVNKENRITYSSTPPFIIPHAVCKLIEKGMEFGPASDIVFGKTNTKQSIGTVGLVSQGVVTRESLLSIAMQVALIPHRYPEQYG